MGGARLAGLAAAAGLGVLALKSVAAAALVALTGSLWHALAVSAGASLLAAPVFLAAGAACAAWCRGPLRLSGALMALGSLALLALNAYSLYSMVNPPAAVGSPGAAVAALGVAAGAAGLALALGLAGLALALLGPGARGAVAALLALAPLALDPAISGFVGDAAGFVVLSQALHAAVYLALAALLALGAMGSASRGG